MTECSKCKELTEYLHHFIFLFDGWWAGDMDGDAFASDDEVLHALNELRNMTCENDS